MHDYLVALYHLCADFHSGQWSMGYRLLCLSEQYHIQWFGCEITLDEGLTHSQLIMYHQLRERYEGRL